MPVGANYGVTSYGPVGGLVGSTGYSFSNTSSSNEAISSVPKRRNLPNFEDLLNQAMSMLNQSYTYNPETDPIYQSAKAAAQRNAQEASSRALAELNRRGLYYSGITGTRLGQIQQQAEQRVTDLIPELAQQDYARRQNQLLSALNLGQLLYNIEAQDQEREERKRQFDQTFGLQEAAVTGRYLPGDIQDAYLRVLELKRQAEQPGVTPEQMQQFRSQADQLRAYIASRGYDPSLVAYEANYSQALQNVSQAPRTPTVDVQRMLYSAVSELPQILGYFPQGSSSVIQGLPAFSPLAQLYRGVEGELTQQMRQNLLENELRRQQMMDEKQYRQAALELDRIRAAQDADYKNFLKQQGISEQRARSATAAYVATIFSLPSREEALQYLVHNRKAIADDGANISELLRAIEMRWPSEKEASSSSASSNPWGLLMQQGG